jgi:hypothetical protein
VARTSYLKMFLTSFKSVVQSLKCPVFGTYIFNLKGIDYTKLKIKQNFNMFKNENSRSSKTNLTSIYFTKINGNRKNVLWTYDIKKVTIKV